MEKALDSNDPLTKELIYKILLITGLVPASVMLFFSFWGISNILSSGGVNGRELILLVSIFLGMTGYTGLLTSMILPRKPLLNFILLFLGVLGFSLFLSLEGGKEGWKWLLTMQEPDEWLLPAWPVITACTGSIVNLIRWRKEVSNSEKTTPS